MAVVEDMRVVVDGDVKRIGLEGTGRAVDETKGDETGRARGGRKRGISERAVESEVVTVEDKSVALEAAAWRRSGY